ncbi:conserved hypothetical protein [[Clostridium] ultunense Esp]|uniref:DUF4829 domain-containing protein n=2 Tax=Schnuerera ultunensis TaxID=45497 RepID=M1Z722_9FIRM|nr:conserved hypothetical protein [[Clostridium] ultunense Esp]SHD78098.1 conserved protein of unknown function [[Clostridium] ultunense Esp]
MRCRGDLWSPVYDYCKLLFNGIIRISRIMFIKLINKYNESLIRKGDFMKKIIVSLFAILLVFSLVACNQKSTNEELTIDIGDSDKFNREEINNAIKIVKDNFAFPASTLTKIWYDEEESDRNIKFYLENGKGEGTGVKPEDIIVLLSNFDVDDSEDNPVFSPGSYENYQWLLIRDNKDSEWMIDDQGY